MWEDNHLLCSVAGNFVHASFLEFWSSTGSSSKTVIHLIIVPYVYTL